MMRRTFHVIMYSLLILFSLLTFFPNVFNRRETAAFDGADRIEGKYILHDEGKTVTVIASDFYDRGSVTETLLGKHHRDLWSTAVTIPVFQWKNDTVELSITDLGGGQQTTSFALIDDNGRSFTLRSVNKDQANALPAWLRKTGIRTLFRDQASALDPYAAPVVDRLASGVGIYSTKPKLFFVQDSQRIPDSLKNILANRIMLLEIEPDKTWQGYEFFGSPQNIISSKNMLEKLALGEIKIDHLQYAYCRLFDIAIGDWDRHGKQWKWAIDSIGVAHPLPMDRDMAFYLFNDGVINKLAVRINPKFQSFVPVIDDISGYLVNGRELDSVILASVNREQWNIVADSLKRAFSRELIHDAFSSYPESIHQRTGGLHSDILIQRIDQLNDVADQLASIYYKNTGKGR